ncbi:formyltetrahydrofolate deformylase [Filimonas effusa]|uniref:Formyltetrahydrofolate deformylase n=1 Tax=Filimonas effusa TaxID=2508721 RepID=A0A4Q1D714_9BACT|nr:formyltetrahydrofolate deformylase [Filimonas effusa]RXK83836.1 formyltetrahydrofolate deformylase [Filimonas effusa]
MVVVIQCKDQIGLVATISGVMAQQNINIISMREHVDTACNSFFTRLELEPPAAIAAAINSTAGNPGSGTQASGDDAATASILAYAQTLHSQLEKVLPAGAFIHVTTQPEKKLVVLVTKEYHCLGDILLRNHFKTLGATVEAVIGNHAILGDICKRFDVPFHLVSHEKKEKEVFEAELQSVIGQHTFDYLVLAKFMRILSPEFVASHPMRIINIHHSFLPAFIGASPYRQAYERGVKLIGATAHFVTNDLDEGPIITQQIIPVNHTFSATDMVKAGKEIETSVLAKALQLVIDDRVFVYQNRTVVFDH